MSSPPLFSVIIPFQVWNPDLEEALEHLERMTCTRWEGILLPDGPTTLPARFATLPLRLQPTGAVSPALKRDQGAAMAHGEFLAFMDDDAYPFPDWLTQAEHHLQGNPRIVAVGGPATTPQSDPFWSRVSGAVFLSRLSGGFPERYVPMGAHFRPVDDWPSVNLIVRKSAFLAVGGFDSAYWPGEDTKLCRDLICAGGALHYLPTMRVHHHRRASLRKHLRQVGNYGFHRGLFVRRYPETSRKPVFFIPAGFLLFTLAGLALTPFFPELRLPFALGLALYLLALIKAVADIVRHESWPVAVATPPYILMTHLWYGARFLVGFFARQYKESLGR